MSILAIDPGTNLSAFIVWDERSGVVDYGFVENEDLRAFLRERKSFHECDQVAIEMIACYGMAVGKEVFETCVWIGRFMERAHRMPRLVFRRDVKMHLCGSARAKDPNVRQALIDRHGKPGTKSNRGKTYGVSGHLWAALAVADYALNNPCSP